MMGKGNVTLYVVKQCQPDKGYNGDIIYCYTNEETALKCAQNLNKTYGHGCKFDLAGNFECIRNGTSAHYYEVETLHDEDDDEFFEQESPRPHEQFTIEVWEEDDFGIPTYYVSNDKIKVSNAKDAMKFKTWEEARSMIKVLEITKLYENDELIVGRYFG